jgi:hypothetical protein
MLEHCARANIALEQTTFKDPVNAMPMSRQAAHKALTKQLADDPGAAEVYEQSSKRLKMQFKKQLANTGNLDFVQNFKNKVLSRTRS